MIEMRTDDAAVAVGAVHHGEPASFRGVGTDSRQDLAGRLYVALQGPRFDGHDFVDDALASGAVAVMVSRALDVAAPSLVCPDTLAALGLLGSAWAQRCPAVFIGITGSNGKTTVKDMIYAILSRRGECLATQGNFNNEIGVPLTLLRLSSDERYAVVEMGAGKPGDIGYLTGLLQPHVGVVTNAGPAHLEFLTDLDGVAQEKGALYTSLRSGGTAVINADDAYCEFWRHRAAGSKVVTFGLSDAADVRAQANNGSLVIESGAASVEFAWQLPGTHHAANAAGGRGHGAGGWRESG